MPKSSKKCIKSGSKDSDSEEGSNSGNNNTSTSSSDFETSRKHKLRRRSTQNVSYHYKALPMRVVGESAVTLAQTPSSSRDITLSSAQIIEDSSDSEFHISNDTSSDETANKSLTFTARPIEKYDLEYIRKLRKRRKKPSKTLYID
ncbi:uncharacterized protein LOC26535563 [Drosophila yakuba]|uniref:uncharacterized protein LOC26535563 n=1 Tax=Drosophila yakuba TaxID=7245 RepID=UPI00193077D9|nr:uncharacterized protein LOC26535563 [Drosophila yakuba]XP_039230717.1 uncharacterized protein LOC26535563 [Drosophila yakuba]